MIRCHGLLKYAEFLPYDERFPVILPRDRPVTRLFVKSYYEENDHSADTNHLLSMLSKRFWVVAGREVIKECTNHCMICKKNKAAPPSQLMAPPPQIRLKFNIRTFSNVGIDFAGPFLTMHGRGKTRNKRYLCPFTCLSSTPVHLEMTLGLDTTAFLNAFYRMVNRRGVPIEVITDNGRCFVAANKELKELVSDLDEEKTKEATSLQKTKCHFNPPFVPHFGGVFEIIIKSAK